MFWKEDEEFTYPNGDTTNASPVTVSWNMDGDDVEISMIEWDDDTGHRHYTGDELWEMDIDLAEDIMSYIENEFIHDEDFWMSRGGYDY